MRGWAWVGLAFLLAGCGNLESEVSRPESVGVPNLEGRSELNIVGPEGTVTVGMDAQDALAAFPKPEGAKALSVLPPPFDRPFAATGWDSSERGAGFIVVEGKVALAMIQRKGIAPTDVGETVGNYRKRFPNISDVFVSAPKARFWFWEAPAGDSVHRLMLCAVDQGAGKTDLTIALGEAATMDAIEASESDARAMRKEPAKP